MVLDLLRILTIVVVIAWGLDARSEPPPPYLPNHNVNKSLLDIKETHPSVPLAAPGIIAPNGNENRYKKSEQVGHGASEFWPPLFGYRFKVTDTLMVWVTFLLFIATVGLFRATKSLVSGAEKMSKQQLRAYLFWKGFNSGPNILDNQIRICIFFRFRERWINSSHGCTGFH